MLVDMVVGSCNCVVIEKQTGDTDMTAFDLFQEATCEISAGNYAAATKLLTSAIEQIDSDGVDAHMRDDIASLKDTLAAAA